jgi:hypothetical protein
VTAIPAREAHALPPCTDTLVPFMPVLHGVRPPLPDAQAVHVGYRSNAGRTCSYGEPPCDKAESKFLGREPELDFISLELR